MSTKLRGVAQRYSDRLATSSPCTPSGLTHNPNLVRDIETYVTRNWIRFGENLGCGGDVSSVHAGLMASAGHRAKVLGAYDYVGIGVTYQRPGLLFVTFDFLTTTDNLATDTAPPPPAPPRDGHQDVLVFEAANGGSWIRLRNLGNGTLGFDGFAVRGMAKPDSVVTMDYK